MLGCGTPRPRPGPRGGGQGPGKLSPLSSRSPNASFALAISARPGSPSDLPRPAAVTPVGRVSAPRWRDGRPLGLERPCHMPLLCPPPRGSFAPAPPLVPRPRARPSDHRAARVPRTPTCHTRRSHTPGPFVLTARPTPRITARTSRPNEQRTDGRYQAIDALE